MRLFRWIIGRWAAAMRMQVMHLGVRDASNPNLANAPAARSRDVIVLLPYEDTFDACVSAVETVRGATVIGQDREGGRILARGGMNHRTFGSAICVTLHRHSETADKNQTHVTITCAPAVPTTIIDWGESLQNVNMIAGHLTGTAPSVILLRPSTTPTHQATLLRPSGWSQQTQPAQLLRPASAETLKPDTEASDG